MKAFFRTLALVALLGLMPHAKAQVSTALVSQTFTAQVAGNGVYIAGGGVTGHKVSWVPVGTVTTCTVAVDSSPDGVSWTAGGTIAGQTCTSAGSASTSASVVTAFIRINVTTLTGGGSLIVTYSGLGNASALTDSDGRTIVVGPGVGVGNPISVSAVSTNDPCASSATTKSHAFANITTATTTALVAPSGSTNIFVCGVDVQLDSNTAGNSVKFENGTGAACATSPTVLTATYSNASSTNIVFSENFKLGFGSGTYLSTGASQGFCAVTTIGTNPTISVDVTFVQQ